jgi:polyphosphate kinase 2 (PPK2 family)
MLTNYNTSQSLPREEYKQQLPGLQLKFQALAHELYVRKRALIIIFEGWDAAGKGGAIRRLTEQLDARGYEVSPIGAPAGEDLTHHYLWRFWRRLKPPEEKQVQIFDRSWYGRVLVERVEKFCSEVCWKRAFREINDFERQLASSGMILVKFWMHITPEEQLSRFEARQNDPAKAWKLNSEDWRNREKWPQYEKAVEEMLLRTSTLVSPWTVVVANDKNFARIKVLKTVVDTLDKELGEKPGGKKKKK